LIDPPVSQNQGFPDASFAFHIGTAEHAPSCFDPRRNSLFNAPENLPLFRDEMKHSAFALEACDDPAGHFVRYLRG
jgi:hypothetical protein